ncbi:MAG: CCA tRNA nucleotidyltransferase [Oscillochloridaceae bacterium umkhey_bin13]
MKPQQPTQLLARLPQAHYAVLERTVQRATPLGLRLWLVGGVVRDLLLDQPLSRDLDLAVEGDALALATTLAEAGDGRMVAAHAPFGTASIVIGAAGLQLDLAQTRSEHYAHPAALPQVTPAPILADLARRDFSLNAMALELRPTATGLSAGQFLDPFDGQADLARRQLRLLHANSLRDDPTRILRGLRLASRLGLEPEPDSVAQITNAATAGYLGLLSAERILAELCLALNEPRPDHVLRQADHWAITPQLVPGLSWQATLTERAERLVLAGLHEPMLWAGVLLYDQSAAALAALTARYPLPGPWATLLRTLPALRDLAPSLADRPPSARDRALHGYRIEAIQVLQYTEPQLASLLAHYLHTIRPARPLLNGDDLRRLGVKPGPAMGQLLAALRAATLDGVITTRAEAESWVQANYQESV